MAAFVLLTLWGVRVAAMEMISFGQMNEPSRWVHCWPGVSQQAAIEDQCGRCTKGARFCTVYPCPSKHLTTLIHPPPLPRIHKIVT